MHPDSHTPSSSWNWQGLCHCYITHLLPCCRVLRITFQSGDPAPSAVLFGPLHHQPSTLIACSVCADNNNATSHFVKKKHDHHNVDFEADSATVTAGRSRGTRQRWPHNRCWRSSMSDADHSWQLAPQPTWQVTSVIQAALKKNKPEKVFCARSLWNDLKMLWCWNKNLCQRVSIKNLDSTARLWGSRRVGEIPLAASLSALNYHTNSWTLNVLETLYSPKTYFMYF